MTRQETVIKITKITRIVGEMKSQLDLDDEIEFEALDSSWMNIGKWAEEICQYMEQAPSPLLADLIANNEFTTPVVNYVQSHRQEIDSAYVKIVDCYAENMQSLLSLCERQEEELKGEYKDLIEPLANEQVATLLQRAIRAGLLDEHYQPEPQTKPIQLKVIAYAVSTICRFPNTYVYFENNGKGKTEGDSTLVVFQGTIPNFTTLQKFFTRKLTLMNLSLYTRRKLSIHRKMKKI